MPLNKRIQMENLVLLGITNHQLKAGECLSRITAPQVVMFILLSIRFLMAVETRAKIAGNYKDRNGSCAAKQEPAERREHNG
jgi:hypothetical protein